MLKRRSVYKEGIFRGVCRAENANRGVLYPKRDLLSAKHGLAAKHRNCIYSNREP